MPVRWEEARGEQLRKNPNRVKGGGTAKKRGDLAEQEFDLAARSYMNHGLLSLHELHAPFITQGSAKLGGRKRLYGYYKKQSEADRLVVLPPNGRACFIEVKSAMPKRKDSIWLLDASLHQYDSMALAAAHGALGLYALRWRLDQGREVAWRLYPVQELERTEKHITFSLTEGRLVEIEGGLPDWLPVVQHLMLEY